MRSTARADLYAMGVVLFRLLTGATCPSRPTPPSRMAQKQINESADAAAPVQGGAPVVVPGHPRPRAGEGARRSLSDGRGVPDSARARRRLPSTRMSVRRRRWRRAESGCPAWTSTVPPNVMITPVAASTRAPGRRVPGLRRHPAAKPFRMRRPLPAPPIVRRERHIAAGVPAAALALIVALGMALTSDAPSTRAGRRSLPTANSPVDTAPSRPTRRSRRVRSRARTSPVEPAAPPPARRPRSRVVGTRASRQARRQRGRRPPAGRGEPRRDRRRSRRRDRRRATLAGPRNARRSLPPLVSSRRSADGRRRKERDRDASLKLGTARVHGARRRDRVAALAPYDTHRLRSTIRTRRDPHGSIPSGTAAAVQGSTPARFRLFRGGTRLADAAHARAEFIMLKLRFVVECGQDHARALESRTGSESRSRGRKELSCSRVNFTDVAGVPRRVGLREGKRSSVARPRATSSSSRQASRGSMRA